MSDAARAMVGADGMVAIRVTPRAASNRIAVEPATADTPARLRVHVTTVPEDGKANKAVIALVAKALGVPKSRVAIVRGETGRDKLLRIAGWTG